MTDPEPLPRLELAWPDGPPAGEALGREWIVTNGLGGYSSGTVALCNTRRYHGLLVPSLPGQGRTVVLSHLDEEAAIEGRAYALACQERADGTQPWLDPPHLRAFRLDGLVPEWEYELGPTRLVRRLLFVHGESAVFVSYENKGTVPLELKVRPYPVFRPHERLEDEEPAGVPGVHAVGGRIEWTAREGTPPLRCKVFGDGEVPFVLQPLTCPPQAHRTEAARGYPQTVRPSSPGYFHCRLSPGGTLALCFSTDRWEALEALQPAAAFELERQRERRLLDRAPERLRTGVPARLLLATDQFLIEPTVRPADEAWARATGQDARSVIAGYHWFTDWGRDTMISLEGLTLATRRHGEAAAILRTFEHYVKDGLLPNLFPEGQREGRYNTADATLWFFHAIDRYLEASGNAQLLKDLFPRLEEIVFRHVQGTRFQIGVDPADGLLSQGADGVQLTWMDALVDGWVVTPRRGKAVEINALWFNALRLMADWANALGREARPYLDGAERAQVSFNKRFWNPARRCLFDVVDGERGDDPSVRPNQIFAVSLRHPVLARDRWADVVERVRADLVTPFGLRTLSPDDPNYKATYDGDLRARDAAYHQGTVWPWLLGHFVDAWLRTHGDAKAARAFVAPLAEHLTRGCVGQVAEIFDAAEPHRPRGCVAQAWSTAEVLRAWVKTG